MGAPSYRKGESTRGWCLNLWKEREVKTISKFRREQLLLRLLHGWLGRETPQSSQRLSALQQGWEKIYWIFVCLLSECFSLTIEVVFCYEVSPILHNWLTEHQKILFTQDLVGSRLYLPAKIVIARRMKPFLMTDHMSWAVKREEWSKVVSKACALYVQSVIVSVHFLLLVKLLETENTHRSYVGNLSHSCSDPSTSEKFLYKAFKKKALPEEGNFLRHP